MSKKLDTDYARHYSACAAASRSRPWARIDARPETSLAVIDINHLNCGASVLTPD